MNSSVKDPGLGHQTPIVRIAEHRDLNEMTRLLGGLFSIESDFKVDEARQREGLCMILDNPTACAWVAVSGSRVIGMCTLQRLISTAEGGEVGLVEDVVVAEDWRGQGVGSLLISTAVAWASGNGLRRLQLLADKENRPALGFYRNLGWVETKLIALRKPMAN